MQLLIEERRFWLDSEWGHASGIRSLDESTLFPGDRPHCPSKESTWRGREDRLYNVPELESHDLEDKFGSQRHTFVGDRPRESLVLSRPTFHQYSRW